MVEGDKSFWWEAFFVSLLLALYSARAGVSHLGYATILFDSKNRVTFGFGVCVL